MIMNPSFQPVRPQAASIYIPMCHWRSRCIWLNLHLLLLFGSQLHQYRVVAGTCLVWLMWHLAVFAKRVQKGKKLLVAGGGCTL